MGDSQLSLLLLGYVPDNFQSFTYLFFGANLRPYLILLGFFLSRQSQFDDGLIPSSTSLWTLSRQLSWNVRLKLETWIEKHIFGCPYIHIWNKPVIRTVGALVHLHGMGMARIDNDQITRMTRMTRIANKSMQMCRDTNEPIYSDSCPFLSNIAATCSVFNWRRSEFGEMFCTL